MAKRSNKNQADRMSQEMEEAVRSFWEAGLSALNWLTENPEEASTWEQIHNAFTHRMLTNVKKTVAPFLSSLLKNLFLVTEAQMRLQGEPSSRPILLLHAACILLVLRWVLFKDGPEKVKAALIKAGKPNWLRALEDTEGHLDWLRALEDTEGHLDWLRALEAPEGLQYTDYLEVLSSQLYHNLRSAYATGRFLTPNGERWPVADLSGANKKLRALAQVRPNPRGVEPYLSDAELAVWQEKAAQCILDMDDLTADVLDIISAAWLKQAKHPEAMATITTDEILRHRRLRSKIGGSGRRGGYWKEWREEIARHMAILANTWITVCEMDVVQKSEKGHRQQRKWRGESPAVVVTSRFGQLRLDNTLDTYAWRVRPGDVFANFLFGPGRQTALISQRALEYDPYRQKWEKRLTRYLSWQWRIRQGKGGYLEPINVEKLLEAVGKAVGTKHPDRTRERLEKALDTLKHDGIIACWQYEAEREEIWGQQGWWKEWLTWKVVVEPPQALVDHYAKLPQTPAKATRAAKLAKTADLGRHLREARKVRKLTLMQAAEEIGISPSYLSKIESGKGPKVSEDTRRKILRWLEDGGGV